MSLDDVFGWSILLRLDNQTRPRVNRASFVVSRIPSQDQAHLRHRRQVPRRNIRRNRYTAPPFRFLVRPQRNNPSSCLVSSPGPTRTCFILLVPSWAFPGTHPPLQVPAFVLGPIEWLIGPLETGHFPFSGPSTSGVTLGCRILGPSQPFPSRRIFSATDPAFLVGPGARRILHHQVGRRYPRSEWPQI